MPCRHPEKLGSLSLGLRIRHTQLSQDGTIHRIATIADTLSFLMDSIKHTPTVRHHPQWHQLSSEWRTAHAPNLRQQGPDVLTASVAHDCSLCFGRVTRFSDTFISFTFPHSNIDINRGNIIQLRCTTKSNNTTFFDYIITFCQLTIEHSRHSRYHPHPAQPRPNYTNQHRATKLQRCLHRDCGKPSQPHDPSQCEPVC